MEDFAIYKDEDRVTYLAYFYERLARHMLHLPLVSTEEWFRTMGLHHYDIEDYPTAYVEVKGVSNTDQLKLFEDQLDAQQQELGFPIDQGFIWIFGYVNRGSRKTNKGDQPRLLKTASGNSWKELVQFLCKQTNMAYIIDIRLIDLLRKANGTHLYDRDKFHDRQAITLNRTTLKSLATDARATLLKLGIPPEEIPSWLPPKAQRLRTRFVNTCFEDNEVNFTLYPLLVNGAKKQFFNALRQTGTVKKNSCGNYPAQ